LSPWFNLAAGADLILFDSVREKELPVRVTIPALTNKQSQSDKFPIIIFSHGLLGSKDGYQILAQFWAENGYVVIQPTHYDSAAMRKPTLTELRDLTPLFIGWQSRPDDIRLILDQLQIIEESLPALRGKLDRQRIAMGGHSFGSHTAMLLGGARLASGILAGCGGGGGDSNSGLQFTDCRIAAYLLISPPGSGRALTESADFDQSSWDEFKSPMMIVTGTEDKGRGRQDYRWRCEAFALCAPGDKFLLVIQGGYHGFGGITGTRFFGSGPANDDHVKIVQKASLAFFDSYLKTEEHSSDLDALVKLADGQFSLQRR